MRTCCKAAKASHPPPVVELAIIDLACHDRGNGRSDPGQTHQLNSLFLEKNVAAFVRPPRQETPLEGTLMLKYVPRTGEWGKAEICQITFTPIGTPALTVELQKPATGAIAFRRAAWADLPTMHHVVNALAELPIVEARAASIARTRGGKSYADTRILK